MRCASGLIGLVMVVAGCGEGEAPSPEEAGMDGIPQEGAEEARADLPPEQREFWANLEEHCGRAYAGEAGIIREGDARRDSLYAGYDMVAHFRQCLAGELRIPGHIGDDRSRTWILTPDNGRLDLRHDHRQEDGTDDETTMYGAATEDPGTPLRQEFTRDGDGYWVLEMVPEEDRFSYGNHDGEEWLVRFDFDLSQPVDIPPPPWGYEDTEPYPPEETSGAAGGFGDVAFPISCATEAQDRFEEGVALLHSFYLGPAREAFQGAADADPDCAMAHWGLAMVHRGNPFAGPASADGNRSGLEAAQTARELGPPTEREEAYVDAALALFEDHEASSPAERSLRYEEAMAEVHGDHPDDEEAAIFYAREVTANASPEDRTFERQLRAAEIMEPLFEENPRHPGLAHYIIHAYDVPELAERGLDAARAYEDIAPDAPHALHMPSHIYTRLGLWDESIEMNRRSAEVDDPDSGHRLHAWDYKVYGFLQQGRDDEAARVLEDARELSERLGGPLSYNGVAMPARYALERGEWDEARALPVEGAEDSPAEAVSRFARGIGAGREGDLAVAQEEAEALARIREALEADGVEEWVERVEAQQLAVDAWVAHLSGESDEAVALADRAGEIEERVEKHPVTPGPLLPARELHGDLLLELDRPQEALDAYEATLEREPNRARTLAGAARAAELAGHEDRASEYDQELSALMEREGASEGRRPGA